MLLGRCAMDLFNTVEGSFTLSRSSHKSKGIERIKRRDCIAYRLTTIKVHWVEGSAAAGSKKQKVFLEHIDADQLETAYGGTLDYQYDFEKEDAQYKSLREITLS